ncbi:MAG: toll/interleukin-1 receptor domain-containing protein [Pseudonocardiaceae bacterium]
MARIFVSHASEDRALAGEVHQWLIDAGHEVFLDQDLRDGIALGEQWEQRLHERLRWANAVLNDLRDHLVERSCTVTGGDLSRAEWGSLPHGTAVPGHLSRLRSGGDHGADAVAEVGHLGEVRMRLGEAA